MIPHLETYFDSSAGTRSVLGSDSSSPFEIEVRAANLENHFDAERLDELFQDHRIARDIDQNLHARRLWSNTGECPSEEDGFTCLVAAGNDRFLAHLAIRHDNTARSLELLLPTFHPAMRNEVLSLFRALCEVAEKHAKRQRRMTLVHYATTSHPFYQFIFSKCLQSKATALIPSSKAVYGHGQSGLLSASGGSALAMLQVVCPAARCRVRAVFPPQAHLEMIRFLYDSLGLHRVFLTPQSPTSCVAHGPEQGPANPFLDCPDSSMKNRLNRAASIAELEASGLSAFRVYPSAIKHDTAYVELQRAEEVCREKCVPCHCQISLSDPCCPAFSRYLEDRGYRFSGILPLVGKDDFIAYSRLERSSLISMRLYTKSARSLRDYMLSLL